MDLLSSVSEIKGVGDKTAKCLNNLGVYSVGDILSFFPRTYIEYPKPEYAINCTPGSLCAIYAKIKTPVLNKKTRTMDISLVTAFSGNSAIELVWFRSPYVRSILNIGTEYIFYGQLTIDHNKLKMSMPAIYEIPKYESIRQSLQPVYHLTRGVNNAMVRKSVAAALDSVRIIDNRLPAYLIDKYKFMSYDRALRTYHFPESFDDLKEARNRLAYEEIFFFVLNSSLMQKKIAGQKNILNIHHSELVDATIDKLPFTLTEGQANALKDIRSDFDGEFVTQRLIQGDVGSGKTLVAFLSMLEVLDSGYSAALMAPTEVLAMQHYQTFLEYVKQFDLPFKVAVLTGSLPAKKRKEMQAIIDENDSVFIIGTHALVSEKSQFHELGLVIVDEQHRFGVKQRETLAAKGMHPFILVMSATPIPRTLAMILYSNMSVSVIKELPKNRVPIKTCVIDEKMRPSAYKFIEDEVEKGHQAYVICPLVDVSETTEAENVMEYSKKIEEYFNGRYKVGILHGKMKPDDKNSVMNDFYNDDIDILVSTTVVEVGVNVGNATVIMIENASRFGLAQLHQLRGRVGRSALQSYCILMKTADNKKQSHDTKASEDKDRLEILHKSNDGFEIAREDLKLRGPGDFFGIRQSGDFNFKIADIIQDASIIESAANDVDLLLKEDPELDNYKGVKEALSIYMINETYTL